MRASKANDLDTLLGLWTEDGVLIRSEGEVVKGIQAITQAMESYREELKNMTITQYIPELSDFCGD